MKGYTKLVFADEKYASRLERIENISKDCYGGARFNVIYPEERAGACLTREELFKRFKTIRIDGHDPLIDEEDE